MSQNPPAADVDAFEDESPDYLRMGILATILLVLVGFLVYTRFINPPKKPFYADLPGLITAGTSKEQVDQVVKLCNERDCGCGLPNCSYNIAECRHMDPGCDNSLRRAGEVFKEVTGKEPRFSMPVPPAGAASPPAAQPAATLPSSPVPAAAPLAPSPAGAPVAPSPAGAGSSH